VSGISCTQFSTNHSKNPNWLIALKLLDQLGFFVHMQIGLVPLGKRIWKYIYETTKIIVMFKINVKSFK
jgi:hypothetical protein